MGEWDQGLSTLDLRPEFLRGDGRKIFQVISKVGGGEAIEDAFLRYFGGLTEDFLEHFMMITGGTTACGLPGHHARRKHSRHSDCSSTDAELAKKDCGANGVPSLSDVIEGKAVITTDKVYRLMEGDEHRGIV